ncbi:MAG: hypothetical protein ABI867_22070 [Kofleriaceae bacterium]
MRSLLVVCLLATTAHADPRAQFQQRNSQRFTTIEVDGAGRIRHVRTADPELTTDDDFTLRGWLQINADSFGGRAEDNDPRRAAGALAFYLLDDQDQITGAAIVHRSRSALDVVILRAARTPDAEARKHVGSQHTQTLRYGRGAPIDCKMGHSACKPMITATRTRSVTLEAEGIGAQLQLRTVGGALRLVICITADAEVPDDPRDLLTATVQGFPFSIDAATGQRFAVTSCAPQL